MSVELIFSLTALGVACLTSVVGIWVERDPRRAKNIAYTLSVLIFLACGVSMVQTYFDELDKEKVQSDMARMLVLLDQLAAKGGDGAVRGALCGNLLASGHLASHVYGARVRGVLLPHGGSLLVVDGVDSPAHIGRDQRQQQQTPHSPR